MDKGIFSAFLGFMALVRLLIIYSLCLSLSFCQTLSKAIL